MAPKKEKAQKLSYGEFMNNGTGGGSWADEVEDLYESGSQPLPAYERKTYGGGDRGGSSYGGGGGGGDRFEGYSRREQVVLPIPENGPYLAHLGNLPYDIVSEDITNFLQDCDVTSVRLIEDRETNRPKGFGYAEFANVEGLKKALALDGESFLNRNIKIRVAEPPKDRSGNDQTRDFGDWSRKGPLPDLPSRGGGGGGGFDRRGPSDFGERRAPRDRDAPADDGKVRDFGNWERKGPLSPLPQQERAPNSRDGSRPRMNERTESTRSDRRGSPAAWGEGRQEGSRPPRREFSDRPERPERAPTAAELDNRWRNNMRPDATVKSPGQSRSGSEAPSSPAPAAAPLASRPKLNLAKRTVSEAPDVTSPALTSAGGDSKANPFGAARPIDTAAREREIEEKRHVAVKEKKEADEKAKEEAREAKEAEAAKAAAAKEEAAKEEAAREEAAKAEAEKQEKGEDAAEDKKENHKQEAEEGDDGEDAGEQTKGSQQPRTPRENVQNFKSRAAESGNWRTASGEQRGGRGGQVPSGPRRGSGGPSRGGRNDGPRPARNGGAPPVHQTQPPQAGGEDVPSKQTGPDAEGWETVTAPVKGRRTQRGRGAAS